MDKGLSFDSRSDATEFARQQQEAGLYPIVYRTKQKYNVIICESQQEYETAMKQLRGMVSNR
jgi:hypothetical protein